MRFVWDAENVMPIARHGVSAQEAEEAITSEDMVVLPARRRRFSAYGATATGRPVRVIYDPEGQDARRVATAYPIRRRVLDRIRQEVQS